MDKLLKNIEIELLSLKKETYFAFERIKELEHALSLVGNIPADGDQA
jgi:hypothetical protein